MHITKAQLRSIANTIKSRLPTREAFNQKVKPKPKKIQSFSGENEILRKGNVLVTDTRLAFIDPFDRMLKTYMFEHMISLQKKYYRTTALNRLLCKGLLIFGFVLLLITLIIDLLDNQSRGFVLVYIPALLSLIVGLLTWRDMRPKYKIEWTMRDGTTDKIATEPMLKEWLTGKDRRESFMDELVQAMNEALSAKSWWPGNHAAHSHPERRTNQESLSDVPGRTASSASEARSKNHLKLVTDIYQ